MRTIGAAGLLMVLAAWPAAAADMPARKPGLWEIKMNFENRDVPGQSMQQCIDAATDAIMQSSASNIGSQNCSKRDVVKSGDTMTIIPCARSRERTRPPTPWSPAPSTAPIR